MNRPQSARTLAGTLLLLVLILVLAAGLRFFKLDDQSFWNDEGNSARIAERTLPKIVEGAAGDIHPPGYYITLAGWRVLVGQSEFALRALSVFFSILTTALVYAIGSRLFDRRVGVLAAFLTAVSPFQVYYAQEARMYALLALLSAASIWLTAAVLALFGDFAEARRNGRPFNTLRGAAALGGYVLVNTIGLYTHYSFPLILIIESLVFIVWLAGHKQKVYALAFWVGLQAVTLALFIPWLPHAVRQIMIWPDGGGSFVGELTLVRTLAYGITLSPDSIRSNIIPLLLGALVGLFPPFVPCKTQQCLRFAERISLVVLWLVLPPLMLGILGSVSQPFLKFLLPSNLALILLVSRGAVMGYDLGTPLPGAVSGNDIITRLVVAGLLFFGSLPIVEGLKGLYFDPAYARDNYRDIAQHILDESGPEAAVILDAPNQWEVFTYYFPDSPNIAALPNEKTEETLDRLLAEHRRIYALYWGVEQQDPGRTVEAILEANAFTAASQWYGGVLLVTYAVPGEPTIEAPLPVETRLGEAILLERFTLSADRGHPGDALGVTLYWQADQVIDERYKVFVHLYAPDGSLIAQHDSEPNGGLAPTDGWGVGDTIADNHGLLLPGDAPPGVYRLVVGMYHFSGDRLPVSQAGEPTGDTIFLQEIVIE